MSSRHRSRERALQMIFQWEASGDPPERVVETYWGSLASETAGAAAQEDAFAEKLLRGVSAQADALDALIRKHSDNWRLERMAAVDRNILRLAVYELKQGEPAPAVVINEALELGRRYSGEKSARFLNGVLDAIRKKLGEEVQPTV